MSSTLDDLLSGGSKSFKFENPGDTVTGTIAVAPVVRQATEFGTGKPLTWDDGRPQEQVVITLNTTLREAADDDGTRSIYIKGWGTQLKAFKAAVQKAGSKPAAGDTFTARFTGYGPKPAGGGFPSKEYAYELVPAAAAAVDGLLGTEEPTTGAGSSQDPWATPAPPAAAAPAAAPTASSGPSPEHIATAKSLIAAGLGDDVILASAPSLTPAVLAALRNAG